MSYIVVGFYTPNYAEFATRFCQSLDSYSIPHHIYPVERSGQAWMLEPLRKPAIVLRAMADHPGKTIILMDVDCTVNGSLEPLLSDADVSLRLIAWGDRCVTASSRVVAFRPTRNAQQVAAAWKQRCDKAIDHVRAMRLRGRKLMSKSLTQNDESLLLHALLSVPNIKIRQYPGGFVGHHDGTSTPLINHESAYATITPKPPFLKIARRRFIEAITGQQYRAWKHRVSLKFPFGKNQ